MPLPPQLPGPGPGSYDLVDYDGDAPHYMSSAVFVSNTSRWTGRKVGQSDELPGPGMFVAHPCGGTFKGRVKCGDNFYFEIFISFLAI